MMQEIGGESFKVCYSGHSSLNEIKEFLRYFQPSDISPIVLPRLVIWFYCFLNNNKRKKYNPSIFRNTSKSENRCHEKLNTHFSIKFWDKVFYYQPITMLDFTRTNEIFRCSFLFSCKWFSNKLGHFWRIYLGIISNVWMCIMSVSPQVVLWCKRFCKS